MTKEEILAKVKDVVNAPTVYEGLKKAGEAYLKNPEDKEAAAAFKKELKADVQTIDEVLPFFHSEQGAKILGKEQAEKLYEAGLKSKASGNKYCICPACQAGGVLLDHEEDF